LHLLAKEASDLIWWDGFVDCSKEGVILGMSHISGCLESLQWKERADSSGSETGKQDLDDDFPHDTHSLGSNVQFTVGGERFVGFSVDIVLTAKILWVYQYINFFLIS
jgi:hypothetical protein